MKLVTFTEDGGKQAIGALIDHEKTIVVLQEGAKAFDGDERPHFADMLAFLGGGRAARDDAEAIVEFVEDERPPGALRELAEVTLLAPVPRPESIRDFSTFEDHLINCIRRVGLKRFAVVDEWLERKLGRRRSLAYAFNKTFYERPLYYKSNRFSVIGPDATVSMPSYAEELDYELEWGVFIGTGGVDIPKKAAREHIGGFTIFNDFSARDIQMKEQGGRLGPTKGKDFDTGNALGPCLVTPDELPDPYSLTMRARVNGLEWSRGTTADMHWSFEELIEYLSRSETLHPGEFLGSGTCSGSQGRGCGLEQGRFLGPGDVVELEVEGIGVLRNQIA